MTPWKGWPSHGDWGRWFVPQRAMWSDVVVSQTPPFHKRLGFLQGEEHLPIEQFVAKLSIEALVVAILPGTPRFDEQGLDPCILQPFPHNIRCKLRAVVRANVLRRAVDRKQLRQLEQHVIGAQTALYLDGQALPAVLVDDSQNFSRLWKKLLYLV